MPTVKYQWAATPPPAGPNVYVTCLTNAKYTSPRWWDGQQWWDISVSRGKKALHFTWPKRARVSKPDWMKRHGDLSLRSISDQNKVRWGEPFKHFSPPEVLQWLIAQGRLPKDWPLAFQGEMRAQSTPQPADKRADQSQPKG